MDPLPPHQQHNTRRGHAGRSPNTEHPSPIDWSSLDVGFPQQDALGALNDWRHSYSLDAAEIQLGLNPAPWLQELDLASLEVPSNVPSYGAEPTSHIGELPSDVTLWPSPAAILSTSPELRTPIFDQPPIQYPQHPPYELLNVSPTVPVPTREVVQPFGPPSLGDASGFRNAPPLERDSFINHAGQTWEPVLRPQYFPYPLPIEPSGVSPQSPPFSGLLPPTSANVEFPDPTSHTQISIAPTPSSSEPLPPSPDLQWTTVTAEQRFPYGFSNELPRASSESSGLSFPPNPISDNLSPPLSTGPEWTPVCTSQSSPNGSALERSGASDQPSSLPTTRKLTSHVEKIQGPIYPRSARKSQTPPSPPKIHTSPIPSGPPAPNPILTPHAQSPHSTTPSREPLAGAIIREEMVACTSCGVDQAILLLNGQESSLASEHLAPFTCGQCEIAARIPRPSRRARNKEKTTHQEIVACNSCGKEHVVLILCGPESSLASERRVTFTCGPCDAAASLNTASLAEPAAAALPAPAAGSASLAPATDALPELKTKPDSGKRKKGPIEHRSDMVCSACNRSAGVGRMQVRNGDPPHGQRRREEWVEPDFDTEVVCSSCWTKYKFCTTCGGGGMYRSGRWRPRQLFHPGKRNCNLSHERIGAVTYNFVSHRCDEISPRDRSAVYSTLAECQLRWKCTSNYMEAYVDFRTCASIVARCQSALLELANFIGSEADAGIGRLIVGQWEGQKLTAKKRKSPPTPPTDPDPEPLEPPTALPPPSVGPRLHGFMGAQVNHHKGVIFIAHACTLNPTPPVLSGLYRGLITAATAATAAHRAYHPTSPPLAHVCVALFPVAPDAPAHLQHSHTSNWGGSGFGPVDKYVLGKPIQASLFDEPGIYPDAVRQLQENWVVAVHELLEWCDLIDKIP
ncbi:hypothetical protein BDK51DRAFT_44285 [Blyttiomyces helicus]|uniref:Uncharacterized protein n=1 Tax=Blyttiomyces helicus TaxID=388810 RepID=A0A4P9WGG1_9FUNG|nr:hypothetical protein BDK51DRAFT_44285 [Blyttiomyces helicus]|eukprot:RKO90995.1 hypothetical protein BDK51DRAFT_44285 [Blyttiomyces helicus]